MAYSKSPVGILVSHQTGCRHFVNKGKKLNELSQSNMVIDTVSLLIADCCVTGWQSSVFSACGF